MPSIPAGPPANVAGRSTCRYLGQATGATVECDKCPNGTHLKVFDCQLHGRCVLSKKAKGGMASCQTCPDFAPHEEGPRDLPELWPGLSDPMGQEFRRPEGRDWAHRLEVGDVYRAALRQLVDVALPEPGPRAGQGVVTVGGGRYWPMVRLLAEMLRLHSDLPLQIWHQGDDEPVNPEQVANLPNVTIHDVTKLQPRPRTLGGWQNKTTALLHSGFEQVLFLDADAYPVGDLQPLFDNLTARPMIWWQDLPTAAGNVKRSAAGIPAITQIPPVQGGQLLFDVPRCWRLLLLAHWLNQHSDFFYVHQYGDQDSWRVGLAALGMDAGNLGPARLEDGCFVCEYYGPRIVHRCRAKIYGIDKDRRVDALPGEEQVWSIRQRILDRTPPAREVFAAARATGAWGPAHPCGSGSTPEERLPYVQLINALASSAGWQSVVDLGTGDGSVLADLEIPRRIGVDCVDAPPDCPARDEARVQFFRLDMSADRDQLPEADVALVKDVWHHWPAQLITEWLEWARSAGKWQWLIATNDRRQRKSGEDCPLGGYRALDPSMKPLSDLGGRVISAYNHKALVLYDLRLSPGKKAAVTKARKRQEASIRAGADQ